MRIFIPTLTLAIALGSIGFAAEMSDMDANADGVLSADEFATGYPDADPVVFAAIDVNADGVIDPDEYKTAMETGGVLNDG